MPYSRALRVSGEPALAVAGTTGGSVINIKNWGTSLITPSSSEVYVLQAPEAGVEKRLVFKDCTTTATPTVKLSTNTAQSVSILVPTGQVTGTTWTVIKAAASRSTAFPTVVKLVGISSVQWLLESVWPITTTPTAAIPGGGITLSTT